MFDGTKDTKETTTKRRNSEGRKVWYLVQEGLRFLIQVLIPLREWQRRRKSLPFYEGPVQFLNSLRDESRRTLKVVLVLSALGYGEEDNSEGKFSPL